MAHTKPQNLNPETPQALECALEARKLTKEQRSEIEVACLNPRNQLLARLIHPYRSVDSEALQGPEDIDLAERKRLNEGLRRRMKNPQGSEPGLATYRPLQMYP